MPFWQDRILPMPLSECHDLFEASAGRVDRERGVIRRVKVLGWESRNGYRYNPAGVEASLYEGKTVNMGHGERGQDRHPQDRLGRLVNARKDASGIWADLEYFTKDPLAEKICEAAERMPGSFGLSHLVDEGDYQRSRKGGKTVIESVKKVRCVDLVCDPATVAGLYESKGATMDETLKEQG